MQHDDAPLEALVRQAFAAPAAPGHAARRSGSRRKRVWELDGHAHCPVIGVCLPIKALRDLLGKARGAPANEDDYDLHCNAVAESKQRGPVAEAVQRELERRYALALLRSAALKSTDALAAWWDEALSRQDVAGPFWATLTHPRCTAALAHRVEGQVHMLQHQVGMASRVDAERFEALQHESSALAHELATAQQRSARQAEAHTRRTDELQALVVLLRAQAMVKDSTIAALQADLQALEAAAPGLRSRHELARDVERLMEQHHEHQRLLVQAQQEAERQRCRAEQLATELQQRDAVSLEATALASAESAPASLDNQAVLCVGGRTASVPVYRTLIERNGGRFLHHDGGAEDSDSRLDATLAAADLVICQAGCVSHNAYWRVKDHCKRTGKRCVFVESPSRAGLERALRALSATDGNATAAP